MFCFCLWGMTGWWWLHVCVSPAPSKGVPRPRAAPAGTRHHQTVVKIAPSLHVCVPPLASPSTTGVRGRGQGVGRAWYCL